MDLHTVLSPKILSNQLNFSYTFSTAIGQQNSPAHSFFRHNFSRFHSYFNISTFFTSTSLTSPASSFVDISSYSQALVSHFKLTHTALASTGFASFIIIVCCIFLQFYGSSPLFTHVHSRFSLKQ